MRSEFKSKLSHLINFLHSIKPSLSMPSSLNPLSKIPAPNSSQTSSKISFLLSPIILIFSLIICTLIFTLASHPAETQPSFLQNIGEPALQHRILGLDHTLVFDIEDEVVEWVIPRYIKIDNTAEYEIISKEDISSWFTTSTDRNKFIIKSRPSNYHNVTVYFKGFLTNGLTYEQKLTLCTRRVKIVLRTVVPEFRISQTSIGQLPESLMIKDKYLLYSWTDSSRIHLKEYSLQGELLTENTFSIHQDVQPIYFKLIQFEESGTLVIWVKRSEPMAFNFVLYNQDLLAVGARDSMNLQPYDGNFQTNNIQIINVDQHKVLIVYGSKASGLVGLKFNSEKNGDTKEFVIESSNSCFRDLSASYIHSGNILLVWKDCDSGVSTVIINEEGKKIAEIFDITDQLIDASHILSYQAMKSGSIVVITKTKEGQTNMICPLLITEQRKLKKSDCISSADTFLIRILDENRIVYVGGTPGEAKILILPLIESSEFFTSTETSCEFMLGQDKSNSKYLPSIHSGGPDKTVFCWPGSSGDKKCFFITNSCTISEWSLLSDFGTINSLDIKVLSPLVTQYIYTASPSLDSKSDLNLMVKIMASSFEKGVIPESIGAVEDITASIYVKEHIALNHDLFFDWDSGPLNLELYQAEDDHLPSWITFDSKKGVATIEPNFFTIMEEHRLILVATNRFGLSASIAFNIKLTINVYMVIGLVFGKIIIFCFLRKLWRSCRGSSYKKTNQEDNSQKSILSSEGLQPIRKNNYNEFRDEIGSDRTQPLSDNTRSGPVIIPEHYFCPISRMIMAVPYDAFSGEELTKTTYEKSAILEAYSKSKYDPCTKDLIYKKSDNLALRIEIETFLKKINADTIANDETLRENISHWIQERGKDNLVRNPMLSGIVYEFLKAVKNHD